MGAPDSEIEVSKNTISQPAAGRDISYADLDQLIASGLPSVGGFRVARVDSIDSTNSYLSSAAGRGEASGLVVCARHQSAGRGRRDRKWNDDAGESLLFSVLFRAEIGEGSVDGSDSPARYGQLVGLAVALVGRQLGAPIDLKWPNDLMVGSRKLAGVLGETSITGSQIAVVVGCGINLNWNLAPQTGSDGTGSNSAGSNPICLSEACGSHVDRVAFLDEVLTTLGELQATPAKAAEMYRQLCATIGKSVRVELEGNSLVGVVQDVRDDGALLLDVNGCAHVLTQGEVVHLRTEVDSQPR